MSSKYNETGIAYKHVSVRIGVPSGDTHVSMDTAFFGLVIWLITLFQVELILEEIGIQGQNQKNFSFEFVLNRATFAEPENNFGAKE